MTGRFGGRGAGSASWCLALVAVGFPYFAGTHKGHPYEIGGFFDVAGNHRGLPYGFFNIQCPALNVQCPSFLGGGFLVLGWVLFLDCRGAVFVEQVGFGLFRLDGGLQSALRTD